MNDWRWWLVAGTVVFVIALALMWWLSNAIG